MASQDDPDEYFVTEETAEHWVPEPPPSYIQPNIITIYEIGEADGVHYIVTEYIQGQTLRQQMVERLTIGQALDIAAQMASALKAAHEAGIVHRDIKPRRSTRPAF